MNAIDPAFGTEPAPRELPFNEEAEQGLLGALLLHNDVADRCEGLEPDHFYIGVHGRIFDAIMDIARAGLVADPVTLRNRIGGDEALSQVGGPEYLARLLRVACSGVAVPMYAREIIDLARRRAIIFAAQDAIDRAHTYDTDATAQIEALEAELFGMVERQSAASVVSLGQAIDAMLREAEAQSTGEVIPIDTGLRALDEIMDGWMPGDLTVGAARPGVGKTALATGIAIHNARKGRPVGMFQLEMRHQQVAARIVSEHIGIPAKPIMRGKLRFEQWEDAARARQALAGLPLHIDSRTGVPLNQFIPRARRMKRQHGIELLIVDYLGLIRVPGVSSYERVTQVSQMMKELARDLDIHVLALHQLNRGNEREARRPSMADLRDSGAVEQDADNIILIHREEIGLKKLEPEDPAKHAEWAFQMQQARGKAEVIVDKQRNGSTGTALLRFDARTTTFMDGD